MTRAPGEVDALSSQNASEQHTLDRIQTNFAARQPNPYLTDEEGTWLLDNARAWLEGTLLTLEKPQEQEVVSVTCPECSHHHDWFV